MLLATAAWGFRISPLCWLGCDLRDDECHRMASAWVVLVAMVILLGRWPLAAQGWHHATNAPQR